MLIVGSSAELLGYPPQPMLMEIASMQYRSDKGTQLLTVYLLMDN